MFNNPFGSFHNIVAEAKNEREQLDRLLTISTPRERLLVVAIAVLLLILSAWLFLGSVAQTLAVEGILVEQGEQLPDDNRTLQTLVWFKSDAALQVEAGMPVVVGLDVADGSPGTLGGEIRAISTVPFSGGLSELESTAPVSVYRVDIALDESLDTDSLAGRDCRIVIKLGRQPPIRLFRMRQT